MDLLILMKSEWSLMAVIFILLFLQVGGWVKSNTTTLHLANVLLLINFALGFLCNSQGELFSGMFYTDALVAFQKNILNLGTLIICLSAFDWLKEHKHLLEFYILLLCTLLGMFFMISSNNFLMFYLGLELSTIPLAALANFDLDKTKSSESAMKMILSSAFASGIMLFGISLMYGTTGTLDFIDMAPLLDGSTIQLLAFIFIFSGFAFKLSAVPFHLWTADVYEGAPVPVTAYLSVISKGSIVFVFISVLNTLFKDMEGLWYQMLFITIVFSIFIGNLFAIRQDNIKRFLAFSSITQVGYILLGLSAGSNAGASAAIYFILVYVFSNLAAFGVIALVSAKTGKENISDYKGFYSTNPVLGWILTIALFSLAGIPPTAGFFGKMFLVTAGAEKGNYVLVSVAALNMVISLYYYLRVVKAIFVDKNETPIERLCASKPLKIALAICMIGVVATGFASGLLEYISCLVTTIIE